LRRKVPASQLPQGQSIRRLDFAHPMRKRITNFGDAKKNLENMQLSRDDPTVEIKPQARG